MGVDETPADGHVKYPQVAGNGGPPPSNYGDPTPMPAAQQPPTYEQPPPPAMGQPAAGQHFVHHAQPIPGIPIRAPFASPSPDQQIVGYQVVEPAGGCSCDLKLEGWLVVIILLLIFWPLAWIPCCLPECFQRYQVPIYGHPGNSVPVAVPHPYPV